MKAQLSNDTTTVTVTTDDGLAYVFDVWRTWPRATFPVPPTVHTKLAKVVVTYAPDNVQTFSAKECPVVKRGLAAARALATQAVSR